MRYLIISLLLIFGSCNVAKKVFRHKESSIIKVHRDSTGTTETSIDTSRKTSLRVIESTDIIRSGGSIKGEGSTDLDQLKISMDKGKPLVVPILDSIGNMIGTLSTSLDPLTNSLKQLVNMNAAPEEYHHIMKSSGQEEKKGITDQKSKATINQDNESENKTRDTVKEVKRSPAWIKIILIISGVVIVLLAVFNRRKIWKWLKNKILKK